MSSEKLESRADESFLWGEMSRVVMGGSFRICEFSLSPPSVVSCEPIQARRGIS